MPQLFSYLNNVTPKAYQLKEDTSKIIFLDFNFFVNSLDRNCVQYF